MKKVVKGKRFILVLLIILVAFITKTYLFDKTKEKQEILKNDMEYTKELLEDRSMKINRVKESISKDVEIVVLKEKGNIQLFHDKTPENNKYIEWIIDSNISLKVYYTAILTIDAQSIEVVYNESTDEINIIYNTENVKISAVNIDNILSETTKGVFGKRYSEKEIAALTMISTEKIKEEILKDKDITYLATVNLENYLINMSHKIGVYNIKIIQR